MYFATGAAHAPLHVPREWADRFKGQFDQGWDKVRAETLARQKKLGLVPADTKLTPRIGDTAKGLWGVYFVVTLVCMAAFWQAGMTPIDAVIHGFSTMGLYEESRRHLLVTALKLLRRVDHI